MISCSKNLDGEQNESQTEKNTKKIFKDLDHVIVEKNKSMRSFVLVLEGGVVIVVGAEDFVFPGKPFDHFGLASLTSGCCFVVEMKNRFPSIIIRKPAVS